MDYEWPDRRNFLKMFGITSAVVAEGNILTEEKIARSEIETPVPYNNARTEPGYSLAKQIENHFRVDYVDVVREHLYYKIVIEADTMRSKYTAFVTMPNKWDESVDANQNVMLPGSLPRPSTFLVQRIGTLFSPTTEDSVKEEFSERYAMTLWLGCRWHMRMPVAFSYKTGDKPELHHYMPMDLGQLPLVIGNDQSFSVDYAGEPMQKHSRLVFWAVLDGIIARGVS